MKQQFESVASRLADLVQQMESEFDLKNQSLDHAMAAEMYFKHQQSEAIVVCKVSKLQILSFRAADYILLKIRDIYSLRKGYVAIIIQK